MSVLIARASIVRGPGCGRSLQVWPAGQMKGDLGDPRLNQRAALYAEAILDKAAARQPQTHQKAFDAASGKVEIEFEFAPDFEETPR